MSLFLSEDEPWALLLPWPDLSYSLLWYGGKPGVEDKARVPPLSSCTFFTAQLHSQFSWQRHSPGTSPLGKREPRTTCVPCPNGKAPATDFRKPANTFWCFPWGTCRSWLFLFGAMSRPLANVTEAANARSHPGNSVCLRSLPALY